MAGPTTVPECSDVTPLPPISVIVLLYAAFGGLWIVLSDQLVDWLVDDTAAVMLISTLKGVLFIAVTSLLLYALLRRGAGHVPPSRGFRALGRPAILTLLVMGSAIAVTTAVAVVRNLGQHQETEIARLQAIAALKSAQIAGWLGDREQEMRRLQSSAELRDDYREWRRSAAAHAFERLVRRLEGHRRELGYEAVELWDERGSLIWADKGSAGGVAHTVLQAAVARAAATGRLERCGPYQSDTGSVFLDFIVPVAAGSGSTAIVVLRTDPNRSLFSRLGAWPDRSASGEWLVFRRDGDHILYLNVLRHRSNGAALLRVPVTERDRKVVKAVGGDTRFGAVVAGVDYRGISTVGVVRGIPGSDWYLAAKVDKAEVYAGAAQDLSWTAIAALLAMLVAGSAAVMLNQHYELAVAQRLSAEQAEALRALQLLDAIAESSTDAIFAKDREGRYLLFNQAAARFVGKPTEEVIGYDDTALFPPEQAALIIAHDRLAMREGRVVTVEEELATTGGLVVFQATKGPLRDAHGEVTGLFGISRDISDLRRVEKTAELWVQAFERADFALALADSTSNRFIDVNPAFARERGYSREELIGQSLLLVYPPELHHEVMAKINALDAVGHGVFEALHQTKEGRRFPVLMDVTVIRNADGRPTRRVAYALDISERQRAEGQLREQLDELRRWHAVTRDREGRVLELKREINMLLAARGQPPRYPSAVTGTSPEDA